MERNNKELTLMIESLEQKMDEKHQDVMFILTAIKEQTTQHNHRLSSLERREAYMKGALAMVGLLLVPIAIYFIQQTLSQASLHDEVQQAVTDAINAL